MEFRPLLWDVARCDPEYPDHYCHNCKRFVNHPKQQMGPRTPIVTVETSRSEACIYAPISHLEHQKRD
jgi:hypothetical protein